MWRIKVYLSKLRYWVIGLFNPSGECYVEFNTELLDSIKFHQNDAAILMINKHLVKAYDDYGTLLHYAAVVGNHTIVQHLISLGSNVDHSGQDGKTPLMLAVVGHSSAIVEVLLEVNADINIINNEGQSALQMAFNEREVTVVTTQTRINIFRLFLQRLQTEHTSIEETARKLIRDGCSLYDATFFRDIQILECMVKQGIEVNSRGSSRSTAILAAAEMNDLQMTLWLIEKGADVNALDESGTGALHFAALHRNKVLIQLLLEQGANPNAKQFQSERTALFMIVSCGSNDAKMDECAEILLQYGAIPQNSNYDVYTFFDYALKRQVTVICRYVIAQLAVHEKMGSSIAETVLICNLDRHQTNHLKLTRYLEQCKQILAIEMFENLSLFDLLAASDLKIKTCIRNESFVSHIEKICEKHELCELYTYYYKTLMKRINVATVSVELENTAIRIICGILNVNESKGYIAARKIVDFLNKKDLRQLCEACKVALGVDS